jgi:hypothetical protein
VRVTVRNAEAVRKAEKLRRTTQAARGDLDKENPG